MDAHLRHDLCTLRSMDPVVRPAPRWIGRACSIGGEESTIWHCSRRHGNRRVRFDQNLLHVLPNGMAWHGMAWHGMAWHGITCAPPLSKNSLYASKPLPTHRVSAVGERGNSAAKNSSTRLVRTNSKKGMAGRTHAYKQTTQNAWQRTMNTHARSQTRTLANTHAQHPRTVDAQRKTKNPNENSLPPRATTGTTKPLDMRKTACITCW